MTGIEAETRESSKPVMFAISEYYAKPYKGLFRFLSVRETGRADLKRKYASSMTSGVSTDLDIR